LHVSSRARRFLTCVPFRHAGACLNKAAGDTNANALDAGLEALVAFLTRADEEFAARCEAQLALPLSQPLT
jgi:hypothetical protein